MIFNYLHNINYVINSINKFIGGKKSHNIKVSDMFYAVIRQVKS